MRHIIFAIDVSGSTHSFHAYHDRIYEIAGQVQEERDKGSRITVLEWSDRCSEKLLTDVLTNSAPRGRRYGCGGTYIDDLFSKISSLEYPADKLILVTDGEIDRRSVEKVFSQVQLKTTMPWKFTEAHIISNHAPSVSVIAPFIYQTPYELYQSSGSHPPALTAQCPHGDVIQMIRNIKTVDELRDAFDRLHDRLVADTLVNVDPTIRDELIRMQKRIVAVSATHVQQDESFELTYDSVCKVALDWYNQTATLDLSGMVSRLVNLCSTTSQDLSAARFERNYKHVQAVQVGADEIATVEVCENYEDPILMDKDMPVVLFSSEPVSVLGTIQNDDIRREIERCPLNLLKYDFLIDAISKRINPVHGLRFCKEYLKAGRYDYYYDDENKDFISPETRKPLMKEILCLSTDATHTKANKACIAKLLTGTNRLCGQYGLWMVVMYCILKQKSFVTAEIGGTLDAFIRDFVLDTPPALHIFLGLDGSGMRPNVKVPVAHALLYGIASTKLWADTFESRDIMRDLHKVYPYMKQVLALLSIGDLNFAEFDRRIRVLEIASGLLWTIKQPDTPAKVVMRNLRVSFMKTAQVGPKTYILDGIDRDPDEATILKMALLEQQRVHQNLKFADVEIPFDYAPTFTPPARVYNDSENTAHTRENVSVYIHPRTLRPLAQQWKEESETHFGDLSGQVSIHYQLLQFFMKHDRFPAKDDEQDTMAFMDQLERVYSSKGCLPVSILFHIGYCIDEISESLAKRPASLSSPEHIKKDIVEGDAIDRRIRLEQSHHA